MRFLAIYKKEMREALPWILAAMAIFGIFVICAYLSHNPWHFSNRWNNTDLNIKYYRFTKMSKVAGSDPMFFFAALGLGLALGVRQFWMPKFSRTWAFTLHRSISREKILFAKLATSLTTFVLGLGLPWTAYYLCMTRPGELLVPFSLHIFIQGWAFLLAGFLIYVGTAVSGLSTGKLFGTKMFYLLFAIIVTSFAFGPKSISGFVIVILAGLAILLPQLLNMIISREY